MGYSAPTPTVEYGREETMAPSSPTVARWELALRIKARREELNVNVKTITDHLGFSRNYWSAFENERAVLADDKFEAMLKLLEFDADEAEELAALRTTSRERGWWAEYPGLDDEAQRFYGLESGATRIRNFESLRVPGLLQTEEYARAVLEADPAFSPTEYDLIVELRMTRQERLSGDYPLKLTTVISQAALHQQVGEPGVLRRQIDHLIACVEDRPNTIEVRVLAFDRPPGPLVGSSTLLLMEFASPHLPIIGWQEAIMPLGVIEDPQQLRRLTLSFDEGLKSSLGPVDSLEMMSKLR